MFHRVRRMTGTESPVESWVGEAKRLWSPIQGGNAGTMANRLFLRVSGVRGDFSDDAFVEQLAVDMLGPQEKFPKKEREARALNARQQENNERSNALPWLSFATSHSSSDAMGLGRAGRAKISEDKEKYAPVLLEKGTEAWLQRCCRNGRYTLPLTASTLAQWESDLTFDTRKAERAQTRANEILTKATSVTRGAEKLPAYSVSLGASQSFPRLL